LDDFHRAAEAITGRKALGVVIPDWRRHALVRSEKSLWDLRNTPLPQDRVPRAALTSFLQHNTRALQLIREGFTHPYALPVAENESYQQFTDHNRQYAAWHQSCQELLEIRALYCLQGNSPRVIAEALVDFMHCQMLCSPGCRLPLETGMVELRPLAARLSIADSRAISVRLAGFCRSRRSYAEATESERTQYLNYLTAAFRDGFGSDWVTNRWKLGTECVEPSPTQDRGAVLGLLYAYTVSNARVPALADRYLTSCITAAHQPCSSHLSFPTPPTDPINYSVFGWDEREKDRVAWALQAFKDDALLLTFILEGYRKAHGAYPTTLQQLIADGWLSTLPVDAFTLKDTICYRRTGVGYILYSRGPDGKDDGGKAICGPCNLVGPDSKRDVVFGFNTEAESNSNSGRL